METVPAETSPRVQNGHREVVRLVTFRGPARDIRERLGMEMPDGIKLVHAAQGGVFVEIEVKTLDDTAGLLLGAANPLANILRRLGDVEAELAAARLALRNVDPSRLINIERIETERDTARQALAIARTRVANLQEAHSLAAARAELRTEERDAVMADLVVARHLLQKKSQESSHLLEAEGEAVRAEIRQMTDKPAQILAKKP